jgi:adenylosuccinate synthase
MPVTVIVGVQWGDEGKGKVIDLLAEKASMVVRFSGGPNAGHTVYNPHGKFTLHLIPAGIFYHHTTCIIGNGVVISPAVLTTELDQLAAKGIDTSRLYISARAHVIMPYHTLLDRLEEEAKGAAALGTTRSGVGPTWTRSAAWGSAQATSPTSMVSGSGCALSSTRRTPLSPGSTAPSRCPSMRSTSSTAAMPSVWRP